MELDARYLTAIKWLFRSTSFTWKLNHISCYPRKPFLLVFGGKKELPAASWSPLPCARWRWWCSRRGQFWMAEQTRKEAQEKREKTLYRFSWIFHEQENVFVWKLFLFFYFRAEFNAEGAQEFHKWEGEEKKSMNRWIVSTIDTWK